MQTYCERCLLYYYSGFGRLFVILARVCVYMSVIIVEINSGDIAATAAGRPLRGKGGGWNK